jgi:thiol-disulfide isomerase/thioredoxin
VNRRKINLLRCAAAAAALWTAAAAAADGELKPWAGGAAPPLALRDLQGVERKLADYRGKVVVLNYWATWCDPCRD